MTTLSALDASFLHMESTRTPMHVGGLLVFKLPEAAPPDYLSQLFGQLINTPVCNPPYNWCLATGRFSKLVPKWKVAKKIDMGYHVRHSALPYPGGEKELGSLVARLHSNHMDMARPLWEFHLIEGLENNRFAIYLKTHHAAMDGLGAMKMVKKWLSASDLETHSIAPWAAEFSHKPKRIRRAKASQNPRVNGWSSGVRQQWQASRLLASTLKLMIDPEVNPEGGMHSALHTPRSLFNQTISPQRRLATQLYDVERFKLIQAATGATINDISLALVGAAIRRYLAELEVLPEEPIVASIPVGQPRSDGQVGNAAIGFTCPLGTDQDDVLARLYDIKTITTRTKNQLKNLSKQAIQQFAILGIAPLMVGQLTGLGVKIPPMFNLVVSNVVATRSKLYLNGAELQAMYPISILFDGYALNITVVGYADRIAVGFTGCRNALPSLQRLAVYTGEALEQLEAALQTHNQAIRSADHTAIPAPLTSI
jgi:diacylglycerol O-acyltransferase